jgi:hypothetical protein
MSTVRYRIIAVSVLMAFSLYLDRVCLGEIVKSNSFNNDVKLSKEQIGGILASFFFTYALFQVPAGWVSDRFGARRMLTGYILAWSVLTALTGFMTSSFGLLVTRLGCGIAQAGAYPTSNAIVRRWTRLEQRGVANSLISFGGRLGGTLAPFLTTMLILYIGGWRQTLWVYGVVGILIAIGYWWTVRDRPAEHPDCDAAEQEFIGTSHGRPSTAGQRHPDDAGCLLHKQKSVAEFAQPVFHQHWLGLSDYVAANIPDGIERRERDTRRGDGDDRVGHRHAGTTDWRVGDRSQRQAIWTAYRSSAAHQYRLHHRRHCLSLLPVHRFGLGYCGLLCDRVADDRRGQSVRVGIHAGCGWT